MNKNYLLLIVLFLCSLLVNSQTFVSTAPENKKVVAEELTGIHCYACPILHNALNEFSNSNPGQIFVIKVHAGGFAWGCAPANPDEPNAPNPDFRYPGDQQYVDLLQNCSATSCSYPSWAANRRTFPSLTSYGGPAMSGTVTNIVPTAINELLSEPAFVNIATQVDINEASNQLEIDIEAYYTANSPNDTNYLHVLILQDGYIGPQSSGHEYNINYVVSDGPNGNYQHSEYDYLHQDRLVDAIYDFSGDPIISTSQGDLIERSLTYDVPDSYIGAYGGSVKAFASRLKVVAFITDGNEVINASGDSAPMPVKDLAVINLADTETIVADADEPQTISARIFNYGGSAVSNFEISYQIDSGEIISETFDGSVDSWDYVDYTFNTQLDASSWVEEVDYNISVSIDSTDDSNPSDNVFNAIMGLYGYCFPSMDCSFGDGLQNFSFVDINHDSGCEGYGDFVSISTDVEQGETYNMSFTTGYGSQYFRVWIDFNDDLVYSMDEIIIDNPVLASGSAAGTYTGDLDVTIPVDAPLGSHLMRVKTNWNAPVPDDACEETQYGETEDYTINIVESLGVQILDDSLVDIFPNPSNGLFNVEVRGIQLDYIVTNMLGQQIGNGRFDVGSHSINLSDQENGIYFVTLMSSAGASKTFKLVKD